MPTDDVAPLPGRPGEGTPGAHARARIWWTRKAVALHAAIVVVVPGFFTLCWWQLERARQGNTLSWAYVFEWPIFAGYAAYVWWKVVHDQFDDPAPRRTRARRRRVGAGGAGTGAAASTEEEEALAAYNRYLAALDASARRRRG